MAQPAEQSSEDRRLQALARYRLLGQAAPLEGVTPAADRHPGESAADIREDVAALTRLAVVVTGLPLAALNLFDATRQVQLSTVGFPASTSPRAESPCATHFLDGELVHTPDASLDPRLAGNAHVDGRLGSMRAYASVPLVTDDGHPLGTLCVADTAPRTLTADQLGALSDLSRVVVSLFERRRQAHLSARLVAEADEQRALAELLIAEADHRHRLLEAVFDSAGVGIVVSDVDGHLMTMNSTATQWLGRPIDPRLSLDEHAGAYDLRSADGTTTLPTGDLPLHRALNEGPVDQVEMVIVAPDGTRRAVVCSARPLHDDDGVLTGAVAALHDVSVLRARESALQDAHDQLTRHADQAATLARAAHSVTTAENPRQAICDAVRELMDADAAFLLQPRGGRLEATATSGLPAGTHLAAALPVPLTGTAGVTGATTDGLPQSLAATSFTSGEFLFVADVAADPRRDESLRAVCDTVSGAWQPITVRAGVGADHDPGDAGTQHLGGLERGAGRTAGQSVGVLAVVWNRPVDDVPATTRAMLSTLAGEAAAAIERDALLQRLARAADHDPLTGLANRRSWDRHAAREIARATRDGEPLSFLLVDLDHFKTYNDTRGHLAGDELLRDFAAAARGCLREVDVLARWGGEEFVAVLPRCAGADAVAIADRIRGCVPAGQSATIGVVQWVRGTTATEALAQADAALYRGKSSGRDRTVLHPPR
ncbi:diguanylate cyclase domain-containing protein [Kineococcus sp. TBRC 1896]|uniref:Diguanylate cyclase domain-containing protein n=1 Tax=Kineococcus mangrovi TaxID=1660183 RepID=A0ABV4I9E6_9ACTN